MPNSYLLKESRILNVEMLASDIKLFQLENPFAKFIPGQFTLVSIPGFGEGAFGIMRPCNKNNLELLVRKVGNLTAKIHSLKKGDKLYLRGPYGNGFPVYDWKKKNLTLIAGGTGIVPIKALLDYISLNRKKFGEIQLMYGAKTPEEILFKNEIKQCQKFAEVMLTVEKIDQKWQNNIGLVTNLINNKTVNIDNTIAVLCGPPIMYKFVIEKLKKMGFEDKNIYLSLEKRMRCGIGKCQHCTCGDKYACIDGPVFRYDEALKFPEGI